MKQYAPMKLIRSNQAGLIIELWNHDGTTMTATFPWACVVQEMKKNKPELVCSCEATAESDY